MSETGDRITAFIRKEARANIRNNVSLNSLFAWLTNMDMTPIESGWPLASDTMFTCVFMSFILTFFTSMAAKKAAASGVLPAADLALPENSPLRELPTSPWLLGICLGPVMAAVFVPWVVGFCKLAGLDALNFWQLLVLKAFYTVCVTITVIKWVVLRLLNYYANLKQN